MDEQKKLSKWKILAIIAVPVILVFSLGFWWLYSNLKPGQPGYFPQINKRSTAPGIEQDIKQEKDWSSYTSQGCQYQLSYPDDWHIYTEAEQQETAPILIASHSIQGQETSSTEVRIQIGCIDIDQNQNHQTIIEHLNERYQNENANISELQPTVIDNESAYFQTVTFPQSKPIKEYFVFPGETQVLIINIVPANSTLLDDAETIIQKLEILK